jgi:hypothetical protein
MLEPGETCPQRAGRLSVLCPDAEDDGHPAHWLHPGEQCAAMAEAAELDTYRDRWAIQLEDLGVLSAIRKSGTGHVRCLIGRTRGDLLEKLRTADVVEP